MENIYNELKGYFYEYQPDEESFLEDSPEVVEQIETLSNLGPTTEEEMVQAIAALCDFLEEWFPDGVDKSEQEEIRHALNAGYAMIEKTKK